MRCSLSLQPPWFPGALSLLCAALALGACDAGALNAPQHQETGSSASPDFAVSIADTSMAGPLDDLGTVTFQVQVQNVGGKDSLGTFLAMYVDSAFEGSVIVNPLPSLTSATFTFDWPAEAGAHTISFSVDPVRPDTTFVPSAEANNTATLALTVPIRARNVVQHDTIPYADLPSAVTNDPAVVQVLALAADSGFAVPAGALTILSRFDGGGFTNYVTPFGNPGASSDSVPLLVITQTPVQAGDTVTQAYILQVLDSATVVVYNDQGGVRMLHGGDSTEVFNSISGPVAAARGALAQEACSENWRTPCAVLALALTGCVGSVLVAIGTIPTVVGTGGAVMLIVSTCAGAAFAADACAQALIDNPPKILYNYKPGLQCYGCSGSYGVAYQYIGYTFEVEDDRGPSTWLTADEYIPTCSEATSNTPFTVRVKDCGGNVSSLTVYPRKGPIVRRYGFSIPCAVHNQGGGSQVGLLRDWFAPRPLWAASQACHALARGPQGRGSGNEPA